MLVCLRANKPWCQHQRSYLNARNVNRWTWIVIHAIVSRSNSFGLHVYYIRTNDYDNIMGYCGFRDLGYLFLIKENI